MAPDLRLVPVENKEIAIAIASVTRANTVTTATISLLESSQGSQRHY